MDYKRNAEPVGGPRCEHCSTRARCVFFALPPQHAQLLKSHIRERVVTVGETLECQGDHGQTVMVIKLGLVKGMRGSSGKDNKAIAILGKGRLLGFNNLFRQVSPLTLTAITPTRVCEVDVSAVYSLAMSHQAFRRDVYKAVGSYFDCVADWSRILREDSYLLKLCHALQLIATEEGSNAFRIPSHSELAGVLGSRRETIARHIGALIHRGMFQKVDRWHGMLLSSGCHELERDDISA